MRSQDDDFLRRAIGLAAIARQQGEFPFGAILVFDQQIVHQATDRCLSYTDPTAHAELLLISEYCRQQITGGRPKPTCTELVNTGERSIEVNGPLLPDEGLAVFAGFDFKPKRERHQK